MTKYIVGIDEVGRGPLAGPVTVCGTLLTDTELKELRKTLFKKIRDSKQLTEKQREEYFTKIKNVVKYKCSSSSSATIDKIGIQAAIYNCIKSVLSRLNPPHNSMILLDGGLKAPVEYNQKTIIKGDEKELSIAIASIIAKVTRDRYMVKLSKELGRYGFNTNKGYGSAKHIEAISLYGISNQHRKTYCNNFDIIER